MNLKGDLDDNDLLRLMLAGDEEALILLYGRRHGSVYRFALQMSGSRTIAEDVTQEVFLFLMRDGHVFDPARGSVSAFLLGVARNYVLRRLRGEQLLAPLSEEFDDDVPLLNASSDLCPLEDLTRAETIESVRKAILSLPAKYREVVVLCELQDVSYGEAAEILGCAIGTVSSANEVKENLGKQIIEGVEAGGTRTTVTIPAGEIGNERPIEIVSERWYSPELRLVVMTRHSDPRLGETTYKLTNINRSEPAKSLFEVPGDYTIKAGTHFGPTAVPLQRSRRPANPE